MNAYILIPLVQTLFSFVLAAIVLRGNSRSFIHRLLFLFLLALGFWGIIIFAMRFSPDIEHAYFWERFLIPLGPITVVLIYHFSVRYTGIKLHSRVPFILYFLVFLFVPLSVTDLVFSGMQVMPYGYAPIFGTAAPFWFLLQYSLIIMSLINFIRAYRTSIYDEQRNRNAYIMIALAILILGGSFDILPVLGLPLYPGLIIGNILFCFLTTVAIVRHRLLDIRIAFRQGVTYALASILGAAPFVCMFFVATVFFKEGRIPLWAYSLLAFALAILMPPLWIGIQKQVDRWFYRGRYDYLEALDAFSRDIHSIRDSSGLASKVVSLLAGALRTSSVYLLEPLPPYGDFKAISHVNQNVPIPGITLGSQGALVKWLEHANQIVYYHDLDFVPQLHALTGQERYGLNQIRAELLIPITTRTGQLVAILILGPKTNGQIYTAEDKQLLGTLGSQMAMALENAQLYSDTLRARQNLETWLNSMTDCVVIVSTDYSVEFMNKVAIERFGNRVGDRCPSFPKNDEMFPSCPVQHYLSGTKDGILYSEVVGDREYDIAAAPLLNPDGSVCVIEVLRDITERKRAEEQLRTLVNNIPFGVSLISREGAYEYVNTRFTDMFGYTLKDIPTGREWFEKAYPNPEYRQQAIIHWLDDLRKAGIGELRPCTFTITCKDGAAKDILFRPVTLSSGRQLITYEDITERKRAEAEKKELEQQAQVASRLATVGEMASGIAHEINNPLTAVIGYVDLVLERDIPEEAKEDVRIIHNGAKRVADIIKRLLAFARQYQPERTYLDINDIIKTTLELRAYELETSNIKATTNLAPDLPRTMADAGQLQQVLLNLIINAETEMKLAHEGGKLSVKTETVGSTIRISFKDDGPGIAKENLEKIFDPFFTTREVGKGTGLGLSLSHGIIAEHNGRIYAKSKPGKGATFIVELPVITEEKQLEMAEPAEEVKKVAPARILVVDDKPAICRFIKRVLTGEGHEVETVASAGDALERIKGTRYNLILLDIKLPDMSGIELYRHIKDATPSWAKRIVFITGDVMGTDTRSFLSRTRVPYITKPFDTKQLKRDINRKLTEGAQDFKKDSQIRITIVKQEGFE